jgi:hypothetical protein
MIVAFTNDPVIGTENFAQQFGNQFCGVVQLNKSFINHSLWELLTDRCQNNSNGPPNGCETSGTC